MVEVARLSANRAKAETLGEFCYGNAKAETLGEFRYGKVKNALARIIHDLRDSRGFGAGSVTLELSARNSPTPGKCLFWLRIKEVKEATGKQGDEPTGTAMYPSKGPERLVGSRGGRANCPTRKLGRDALGL